MVRECEHRHVGPIVSCTERLNVWGILAIFIVPRNWPFPSCVEPHCKIEAKCLVFIIKISFHSYANQTNFHMISFALNLAFIMRFTKTRKWPVLLQLTKKLT